MRSLFAKISSGVAREVLTLVFCCLLIAVPGGAVAEKDSGHHPLNIEIVNITNTEGPLRLQILNSKAAFAGKSGSVAALIVPAADGSVRLSLDSLPAGEYAIRVMQDLDGDGQLNSNAVGMPTEPWGISNDAVGQFGPPSWSDAKFSVPGSGQQTITLR